MNDTESTPKRETINVLTVGMDQRKQALFRLAFEMHTLQRYQLLESTAQGQPSLAIVDFDTPDAYRLWAEFRNQYPDLPALIVATTPPANAPAPVLLKPIRVETLFPELRQLLAGETVTTDVSIAPAAVQLALAGGHPTSASATAPTASRPVTPVAAADPLTPPEASEPIRAPAPAWPKRVERFDPRVGLLGILLKLKRHQSPGVIRIAGQDAVLVIPERDRAALLVPEAVLREACTSPTVLVSSRPLAPDDRLDALSTSLTSLLWQVSLWSSRGRLLVGFPENGKVHLRHWPNLTRLAPVANGLRLAAFWVRSPATLPLTLRMLRVSPQEMFDFLAATYCIGILELPKKVPQTTVRPITEPAAASTGDDEDELHTIIRPINEPAAAHGIARATESESVQETSKPQGRLLSRLLRKVASL